MCTCKQTKEEMVHTTLSADVFVGYLTVDLALKAVIAVSALLLAVFAVLGKL